MVVKPINLAVEVGSQSIFECSTDSTERRIQWHFAREEEDVPQLVFVGYSANKLFGSRYSIDMEDGRYTLTITNTRTSDSGKYSCEETGDPISSSAELIVFGKIAIYVFHKV